MSLIPREAYQTTLDGKQVDLYYLTSENLQVAVTNYGGIIVQLLVRHAGGWVDVVQGMPTINAMLECPEKYFGALVGRVCNRIGGAAFELGGRRYQTVANVGPHTLHSAAMFSARVWDCAASGPAALELTTLSPDGEGGFPGNLRATARYELVDGRELRLTLTATTDADTVVSMTSHPFFSLDGAPTVAATVAQIRADRFVGLSTESISERVYDVATDMGGLFDFRTPRPLYTPAALAAAADGSNPQLANGRGYDHNFVLAEAPGPYREVASFTGTNGLRMTVLTNQPGMQLYTGNWLDGSIVGKYGVAYGPRSSFCAECQNWPNAPNRPEFPSALLRPGEEYRCEIGYRFE